MMKYPSYTCDLVPALELASPASCKTPATFIDSTYPNNYHKKATNTKIEIQLPTNHIVIPWPTYTEPRAKRGRLRTQA